MWPARRRMRFSVTIACCWAPPHGDAGSCRTIGSVFWKGSKGRICPGRAWHCSDAATAACIPIRFCDAVGILREELAGTGCRFVGAYAPQNYSVTDSKVCEDGKFVGLAIDEADSEAVSSEHLKQWIAVLKEEGV